MNRFILDLQISRLILIGHRFETGKIIGAQSPTTRLVIY
jgi:hypothetical protein